MFPRNPKEMQEYCNSHDIDELTIPEFAFYSGPMMAVIPELFDTLDTLCYKSMYYLPFKYIGFFRNLAKKATAKQLKDVMRDMTIDLDEYGTHYENNMPGFDRDLFSKYCDAIKAYLASLIRDIRQYQKENGVLESVVTNYAPVITYSSVIQKQSMADESTFTKLVGSRMDTLTKYLKEYQGDPSKFATNAMGMLMDCVHGVIAYQAIAYTEIFSVHDCYKLMVERPNDIPYEVIMYWAYVCGCIHCMTDAPINLSLVNQSYHDLIGANGKLTDSDYIRIFECMAPQGQSIDELALEGVLPDVDTTNEIGGINDTPPIPEFDESTVDMDKIRTIIAGMRYIDFNQIANQQFLEHIGTDISNYSYIGDNKEIIVAQINGCSCIPYSDIADDHKLKVLVIRSGGYSDDNYSVPIEKFTSDIERGTASN